MESNNERLNQVGLLIAFLFASTGAMSKKVLAKHLEVTLEFVDKLVSQARPPLRDLGLVILDDTSSLEISIDPVLVDLVADRLCLNKEAELSSAGVEALAIISYLGGARKGQVDLLRGVNNFLILRKLLQQGWVTVEAEKDVLNEADLIYYPSNQALAIFGASKLEELPGWLEKNRTLQEQLLVLEKSLNEEV